MPNITQWLIDNGISKQLLLIVNYIPILVTLTAVSRYIFGIKTFGIYAPMILALSFYFMGIEQALIITALVVLTSWATRNLLKKIAFHYISRIAIIYGAICVAIIAFLALVTVLPLEYGLMDLGKTEMVIPIAMVVSVTDRFVANYIKKGPATALRLTGETLLIALLGWALISVHFIQEFVLYNPWLILVTIAINYYVGKYSGIRWTELIRFSQVIKNVGNPKDN